MILTCPSCGTQYVVKDGAIPPDGRQVRCASCKHSWHQGPEEATAQSSTDDGQDVHPAQLSAEAPPLTSADTDATAPIDNELQDREASEDPGSPSLPSSEPKQDRQVAEDYREPEAVGWVSDRDDEFEPFGAREEADEEPRRSAFSKLLLVVLLVAALAAAFWFLAPPEWKARMGLADASGTPLQLKLTKTLREPLESGNDLVTVSGGIINPTGETQNVPVIRAELRKKSGEMVYSWTIAPPARRIPPGGTAPFNSAEVNVPRDGEELTISFAGAKA